MPTSVYRRRSVADAIHNPVVVFCRSERLPTPELEYRFHPTRRWRFDYAWPEQKVALEQEGGVWSGGRHTSGAGFMKDCEKYNTATVMGWRIIRGTPSQVRSLSVITYLLPLLKGTDVAPHQP